MIKVLKNTTGVSVDVNDAGIAIQASSQVTIDPSEYALFASSDDIITLIGAGTIVVNDGTNDLSIAQGVGLIQGSFIQKDFVDSLKANNRFKVDVSGSLSDGLAKVSSDDSAGFLENKIMSGSNKLSRVINNPGSFEEIEFDIEESNIEHQNLSGAGTNTHAQIDSHITDTNNPHNTTITETISADSGTNITTTELETLSDGSDASNLHNHDSDYYTKTLLDGGQLDNRYYTETEVDSSLASKQDTSEKGQANGYTPLDGNGYVPLVHINPSIGSGGGWNWLGLWNADTNIPDISSTTPANGDYYEVAVAGNTNLSGETDWGVGDHVVYNGSFWEKIDNSDSVTSVNGETGAVSLNVDDLDNTMLTTPANGEVLTYQSGQWINSPVSGGDSQSRFRCTNLDFTTDLNGDISTAYNTTVPIVGTVERIDSDFTNTGNNSIRFNFTGRVMAIYNLHLDSFSQRTGLQTRFKINNVGVGGVSSSAYIRNSTGHNEASLHMVEEFDVNTNEEISIGARREAASGSVFLQQAGSSNMILIRIE